MCLILLVLVGCGGGAGTTTAGTDGFAGNIWAPRSSSDADDDDLRQAVEAYSEAFLTGDADVGYVLYSQRCKHRVSKERFVLLTTMAAEIYGPLPITSYAAEISGDFARVTYTFDVSELDQETEPWVRELGQWRQDDC